MRRLYRKSTIHGRFTPDQVEPPPHTQIDPFCDYLYFTPDRLTFTQIDSYII